MIPYSTTEYSNKAIEEYNEKQCAPLTNYELYLNQKIFKDEMVGIEIYPSEYFCPNWVAFGEKAFTDKTVAIHWNQSSWWNNSKKKMRKINSFRYKNPIKRWWYIHLECIARILTCTMPNKTIRKKIRNYIRKFEQISQKKEI